MSRWQRVDRLATAGRSVGWVAVAAIPIVVVAWLFQPTSLAADTSGSGWIALVGLCYALLTALTLIERADRLRRRQATVATEWTIHAVAQLAVLLACGLAFFHGGSSGAMRMGLGTMIAAATTVALLASVWELVGRFATATDDGGRGMFRMFRWNVASPARGVVLATATLVTALVLAAAILICELTQGG